MANKAQPLCLGSSYNKVQLMRFIYRERGGKERDAERWKGKWIENNVLNLEEAGNKQKVKGWKQPGFISSHIKQNHDHCIH